MLYKFATHNKGIDNKGKALNDKKKTAIFSLKLKFALREKAKKYPNFIDILLFFVPLQRCLMIFNSTKVFNNAAFRCRFLSNNLNYNKYEYNI
jgi:hypothetical protein